MKVDFLVRNREECYSAVARDDWLATSVAERLRPHLETLRPDLVINLLGIGRHVDHAQTRRGTELLLAKKGLVYCVDQPYLCRHPEELPRAVDGLASLWLPVRDCDIALQELALKEYRSQHGSLTRAISAISAFTRYWGSRVPFWVVPGADTSTLEDSRGKKVFVIQPHPDDACASLGSVMAKLIAYGCEVSVFTVCDGDAPTGPLSEYAGRKIEEWGSTQAACMAMRRTEDQKAMAILGVTGLIGLGLPDAIFRYRSVKTAS